MGTTYLQQASRVSLQETATIPEGTDGVFEKGDR